MAAGHRKRLIEKVMSHGIEILYDHEFLELCLFAVYKRCDTNQIAHNLLKRFGSIENVCNASVEELCMVDNVGRAAASYIKMLPNIAKGYMLHTAIHKKERASSKEAIFQRCIALLDGYKNEVAYAVCLDRSNHILKEVKVAEGAPGSVQIEPRKIIDAIASTSTEKLVICHNHPSGNLIPSKCDIVSTQKIMILLESIGIEFIDHIIVSDGRYVSCRVI